MGGCDGVGCGDGWAHGSTSPAHHPQHAHPHTSGFPSICNVLLCPHFVLLFVAHRCYLIPLFLIPVTKKKCFTIFHAVSTSIHLPLIFNLKVITKKFQRYPCNCKNRKSSSQSGSSIEWWIGYFTIWTAKKIDKSGEKKEEYSHDRIKMTKWIWLKFCEHYQLYNNNKHYLLNWTETINDNDQP